MTKRQHIGQQPGCRTNDSTFVAYFLQRCRYSLYWWAKLYSCASLVELHSPTPTATATSYSDGHTDLQPATPKLHTADGQTHRNATNYSHAKTTSNARPPHTPRPRPTHRLGPVTETPPRWKHSSRTAASRNGFELEGKAARVASEADSRWRQFPSGERTFRDRTYTLQGRKSAPREAARSFKIRQTTSLFPEGGVS